MSEVFTTKQTIAALKSFLDLGEQTASSAHKGYYSGSGWAARALRAHMEELQTTAPDMTAKTPRTDAAEIIVPLAASAGEGHRLYVDTNLARELETELATLTERLAGVEKERNLLQSMYGSATAILGDDQVMEYVTSGNAVPVTRCTVSADLIRQLVDGRREARETALAEFTDKLSRVPLTEVANLASNKWNAAALTLWLFKLDMPPCTESLVTSLSTALQELVRLKAIKDEIDRSLDHRGTPNKPHCCIPDCDAPVRWIIVHGPAPTDVVESCVDHVGHLLTDAKEHRVYHAILPTAKSGQEKR